VDVVSQKKITSEVVVAYWQCPRKAFLLLNKIQQAIPHELDLFINDYRLKNQQLYFRKLQNKFGEFPCGSRSLVDRKSPVLFNIELEYEDLFATVDVLLKLDADNVGRKDKDTYTPVLVSGTHLVRQEYKVCLSFIGILLSHIQHSPCTTGKLIGIDGKTHLIKFEKQAHQVQEIIRVLRLWIQESSDSVPDIFLNKHCPLCPFRDSCYSEALQIDHLSLLPGLSCKQVQDYNKKGIFTVAQLAYTYRARRYRRRRKQSLLKYNPALKAMAIRDNLIYVLEKKEEQTFSYPYMFLDVEGVPDRCFYYLIGLLIVTQSAENYYSFWADQESDEESIWQQFLKTVEQNSDFTIFHYGSYDGQFINAMVKRYSDENDPLIDKIRSRTINVLKLMYGSIYFPTYSNSLKNIGSYIGYQWTQPDAHGLQSIAWRYRWEKSKGEEWKNILLTYNSEDCHALKHIISIIQGIHDGRRDLSGKITVKSVEDIKYDSIYKFGKTEFLVPDFEYINNCSYYDYQRDKVYFRAKTKRHKHSKSQHGSRRKKHRINKQVEILAPKQCEHCSSILLYRHSRQSKVVFDIRFNGAGLKRWVVQYQTMRVKCRLCNKISVSKDYQSIRSKYGHGFFAFIVYNSITLRQSYGLISRSISTLFEYHISRMVCDTAKQYFAALYAETYENILLTLRQGKLVHVDETTVRLRYGDGYIWVFASMTEVAYVYSSTREGSIPKENLTGFTGVLVSDFFSAYDALECAKQRCLIHLIRDMNDDLCKNPFDSEFKLILQNFGDLMRLILNTIDRFGLKTRYLRKHKKDVSSFYNVLLAKDLQSEVSLQYRKRLCRWREELFTFLDHDGIPWNNNNAEHAVKAFADHRKNGNGFFTEAGIKRFLVLLSVHETCRYREIDFLDFLQSERTDLLHYPSPVVKVTGGD
jgi:predicted RecB family nuclease